MIPDFDQRGLLPPGEHCATFEELRKSVLVSGPSAPGLPGWDAPWRKHLAHQAEILVRQLWQVGVAEVFLNGSFVENKLHPNDIDGYFACGFNEFVSRRLERRLNALDPHSVWTWDPASRRSYRSYAKKQLPMWHVYRVELYPHYGSGPPTGIASPAGDERLFPAAFRHHSATGEEKGIVKIIPNQ